MNLAFNLNVLKGFIPIFDSYAVNVVKDMEKNLDGEEIDLLFPLAQLTARTVAGKNYCRDSAKIEDFPKKF